MTVRNGRKNQGGTVYTESDSLPDKFIKSFAIHSRWCQTRCVLQVNADKIAGALGKDLTKGGKPLKLKR